MYVKPANWHPFSPNGLTGIRTGAALIFFAYIGFDAVSTAAEECRNPQKDMPIGMIGSLAICTVLYVATSLVLTGMVPIEQIRGSSEPLAKAFSLLGMNWAAGIVAFGAVIATTAVLLVFQYGQARIFFSMARDGLLPQSFAKIHPKYKTPHVTTIWIGIAVALLSAFANLDVFVELTNIGTLFAFVLVCIGIMILRHKDPDRRRPFRTPFVPLVPILGIVVCIYLMSGLPFPTWIRFGVWLLIGLVIYFLYGFRKSRLATPSPVNSPPACYTPRDSAPGRPASRSRAFSSLHGGGNENSQGLPWRCVWRPALAPRPRRRSATKKYDWQPIGGVQDIDVRTENVVVSQVLFDMGGTMKGTPLRKSSANVRVRIDNNGETDEEVGVAVVVFDAEGNVVAAGSQRNQVGIPQQGRPDLLRDRLSLRVPAPRPGGDFIVTLETRAKGSGKTTTPTAEVEVGPRPSPFPTPVP